MWRKKILPYFQYSRNERIGLLTLVIIIILLWVIPTFLSSEEKPFSETEIKIFSRFKDSLLPEYPDSFSASGLKAEKKGMETNSFRNDASIRLYPFDPNTAVESDWENFGLKLKTISVIRNYLSKGGRFRRPEDLNKVYGLRTEDYQRLLPYIRIKDAKREWTVPPVANTEKRQADPSRIRDAYKKKINPVYINTADSSQWDALPGIGMKLTERILKFRKQLGGFHSVDQVAETFGLQDSVFQKIRPWLRLDDAIGIRKLHINRMSSAELEMHPYISRKLASVIVAYRESHGFFEGPHDLKKIALVTDEFLERVRPYLDFSK